MQDDGKLEAQRVSEDRSAPYNEETDVLEDSADVTILAVESRKIQHTRVYHHNDVDLYRLLGSAAIKMSLSPIKSVKLIDPNRPYLCLTEHSVFWSTVKFDQKFRLRHGALPQGDVLLLDDYRAGRDGRLWRACTKAGLQCVIKFAMDQSTKEKPDTVEQQESRLRLEADRWNRMLVEAVPKSLKRMTSHCRRLGGRLALVMPYAEECADGDFRLLAEKAFRLAASVGLEHGDPARRHVRELLVSPCKEVPLGMRVPVLIDWTEAKEISDIDQTETVQRSLEALFRSSSPDTLHVHTHTHNTHTHMTDVLYTPISESLCFYFQAGNASDA
jgi:hypothetical protein